MGLAASQCRLLLLTARLSDTEYRAQMISQRRMALAMQTEQIATDYSRALNNRVLKHVFDLEGNSNTPLKEALTYHTLTCENSRLGGGQFRVIAANGKIAVASEDEIPGVVFSTNEDGERVYSTVSTADIDAYLASYTGGNAEITSRLSKGLTMADYTAIYSIIKDEDDFKAMVGSKATTIVTKDTVIKGMDNQEYVLMPALNNVEFFQNCIRTGSISIEQYQEHYAENNGWASFNPLASQFITDDLNTADDAAAQAEYEAKSAMIQAQDKFLEIELKQVETQHQAAQTEYDSVKKVIDKNIERSFKTFG